MSSFIAPFYEYGGIKTGQNTKSHICDDYGRVFCGVKSNWMQSGEPVVEGLFIKGSEHLFPLTDKRHHACKKCLKTLLTIASK